MKEKQSIKRWNKVKKCKLYEKKTTTIATQRQRQWSKQSLCRIFAFFYLFCFYYFKWEVAQVSAQQVQ